MYTYINRELSWLKFNKRVLMLGVGSLLDQLLLSKSIKDSPIKYENMVAVGESARACLKMANKIFNLSQKNRILTSEQINELHYRFTSDTTYASSIILKYLPERIHTLLPGLMILTNIVNAYGTKNIYISKYGIREEYLKDNILKG